MNRNNEKNSVYLKTEVIQFLEEIQEQQGFSTRESALDWLAHEWDSHTTTELQALDEDLLSIFWFITQLPSDNLLYLAGCHLDLLQEWLDYRLYNRCVAKSFLAACLQLDADPLKKSKKRKEMKKWDYEDCMNVGELLNRLWYLLKEGESYIKEDVMEKGYSYPFNYTRDLFYEIVTSIVDKPFSLKCRTLFSTSPYLINVSEWKKRLEISTKAECTQAELEILLQDKDMYNSNWMSIALEVFERRAKGNESLKQKLEAYYRQANEVSHLKQEIASKRTSQGRVCPDELWVAGQLRLAGKRGVFA